MQLDISKYEKYLFNFFSIINFAVVGEKISKNFNCINFILNGTSNKCLVFFKLSYACYMNLNYSLSFIFLLYLVISLFIIPLLLIIIKVFSAMFLYLLIKMDLFLHFLCLLDLKLGSHSSE